MNEKGHSMRPVMLLAMALASVCSPGQEPLRPKFQKFDVSTVRPVEQQEKRGRSFRLVGANRWEATNFSLKNLIALAYDMNPSTISGGPSWTDSATFDIEAVVPGDGQDRPTRAEQMQMLRALLLDRFSLHFHRAPKEFSTYEVRVGPGGPKLKAAAHPEDIPYITAIVYSDKVEVPAKGVTMADFVALLQRAALDRPVLDATGLKGRYDFTLDWAHDESQFEGEIGKAPEESSNPPLATALREQLGLKLVATRSNVEAIVLDAAEEPSGN